MSHFDNLFLIAKESDFIIGGKNKKANYTWSKTRANKPK